MAKGISNLCRTITAVTSFSNMHGPWYNRRVKFLLQNNGTNTGAFNSCSYAKVAVASIDNKVLDKKAPCFKSLVFFERYKDDCFSLSKGSMEKFESFHNLLNSLKQVLRFTMEVGICFLDLKISIINGQLETTVYSKPTYSTLYLYGKSCHKTSSIRGIQKDVALR